MVDEQRSGDLSYFSRARKDESEEDREDKAVRESQNGGAEVGARSCAAVEEMGEGFAGEFEKESLRVRGLIKRHFKINGV